MYWKVLRFIFETKFAILLFANIYHFQYIFESYYYLGDCSSGLCVCNHSKRSCTDFSGCSNCENSDPPMTMGEGQDDDTNVIYKKSIQKNSISNKWRAKIYSLQVYDNVVFET